jgi:hypothetical protein
MNDTPPSSTKKPPWNKGVKGAGGRPKGGIPWNKGLKGFGNEWRDKLNAASSETHKGKPKSPEHKARIAASNAGKAFTDDRKAAISKAAKGRKSWNKGLNKIDNPDIIQYGKPGASHWNWQGGIAEDRSLSRMLPEYRIWRTAVYRRDGYRCVVCGGRDRINADHILRWRDFPQLRYEIENGQTLCYKHHLEKTNEERRNDARRVQGGSPDPRERESGQPLEEVHER